MKTKLLVLGCMTVILLLINACGVKEAIDCVSVGDCENLCRTNPQLADCTDGKVDENTVLTDSTEFVSKLPVHD